MFLYNFYLVTWFVFFESLLLAVLSLISLLISIAYFTLAERKFIASVQRRCGPNVVGFWGLLQPLADGLKLVLKEIIIPNSSNQGLFIIAPLLTLILSFSGWVVIPNSFDSYIIDLTLSLMFILLISALGVYGILFAGWASNSKYAVLGGLRSISQMISYEVSISLIILPIILMSGSLNLIDIVYVQFKSVWFILPLLPLGIIFLISILAETNRTPFDLPEAEAELVAGYNVEYSSIIFAMFFLGEYSNILLMSSLFVILFLGGWDGLILNPELIFSIKIGIIVFFFIFIRANVPRYRYDQLMQLGWKIFLPLTLSGIFFCAGILICFNALKLKQLHYFNQIYFKGFF
jgi:NADH-quinone oxidoreductase subunit H